MLQWWFVCLTLWWIFLDFLFLLVFDLVKIITNNKMNQWLNPTQLVAYSLMSNCSRFPMKKGDLYSVLQFWFFTSYKKKKINLWYSYQEEILFYSINNFCIWLLQFVILPKLLFNVCKQRPFISLSKKYKIYGHVSPLTNEVVHTINFNNKSTLFLFRSRYIFSAEKHFTKKRNIDLCVIALYLLWIILFYAFNNRLHNTK